MAVTDRDIELAKSGDEAATEVVILEARKIASRVNFNAVFAEDAVQETTIEVWSGLQGYSAGARGFASWVNRIHTHNLSNSLRQSRAKRRDYRRRALLDHERLASPPATDPSRRAIAREHLEMTKRAADAISKNSADVIWLRSHGNSYGDIEELTGLSPMAAAGIVKRLKSKLKDSVFICD